jgi:hypothetical protein
LLGPFNTALGKALDALGALETDDDEMDQDDQVLINGDGDGNNDSSDNDNNNNSLNDEEPMTPMTL